MKHFLELVADSLRNKMGNDLSRTVIIFPNKRASLFLNSYLLKNNDDPIWAPQYLSIKEFFCSLAPELSIADPIETIIRLYKLYKTEVKNTESLDHFYGWGERILADFEDVDKNMGNAKDIFRDLTDYQNLSTADEWLDEDQKKEFEKFVGDFAKNSSVLRDSFKEVWDKFYSLYNGLRDELFKHNEAYEGQLYRYVVEQLKSGEKNLHDNFDNVVFVGFNVLDEVEKELFRYLSKNGKALFYWDYDEYYVKQLEAGKYVKGATEAGTFLKDNLNEFKNELEAELPKGAFDNICKHQKGSIIFAEADTDTIQTQYIPQWLNDKEQPHIIASEAQKTAIVLCNENMLQPALHSLPFKENVKAEKNDYAINVTKGFPLGHTSAYALLVTEMQNLLNEGYFLKDNEGTLKISLSNLPTLSETKRVLLYLQNLIKEHALIDDKKGLADVDAKTEPVDGDEVKTEGWLQILHTESYYALYTVLSNFIDLVDDEEHLLANAKDSLVSSMSYPTMFKLMRQIIRQRTIPFHGEPAIGLQVMGVLETRCIDFDHVLMLSVGEGILPQRATDASFIPFIIRKHYGLTTYVRKTAVFAYYFYRLLQRAKTITLVYNSSTSGMQSGEMSRFMRGMLADESFLHIIKRMQLTSEPQPSKVMPFVKRKSFQLDGFKGFSPSALNKYLECPRAFYYEYVEHLKTSDKADGIIDQRDFGNVFHKAAEVLYSLAKRKYNQAFTPQFVKKICSIEANKLFIERVIRKSFKWEHVDRAVITEALIKKFMKNLLAFEATDQPKVRYFDFFAAEYKAETYINVPYAATGKDVSIRLYGSIDRIDKVEFNENSGVEKGECLRIVDYKTGGKIKSAANLDELFNNRVADNESLNKEIDFAKYTFQTFMYCLMLKENPPKSLIGKPYPICPALYHVNHMSNADFTPYLLLGSSEVHNFNDVYADFKSKLRKLIEKIIDPNNSFDCRSNADDEKCKYCIYKDICN